MNLGGLDGSITALGNRVKLTGKAAGLARRAVYAVSYLLQRWKKYGESLLRFESLLKKCVTPSKYG